jgi:hypothetical protein
MSSFLFLGPTGSGKCLGENTPIIMYDGSVKMVQDILVGDKLLGPDGSPRSVLSLASGKEMLYRVNQTKGDSYVVNESHILSLKKSGKDNLLLGNGKKITEDDTIINISVKDYLNSNKTVKHRLKGWKPDAIEFHGVDQKNDLPLDPYWIGLWIGDGRSDRPSLCKPECNAVQWWKEYALANGYNVSEYSDDTICPEWTITNGNIGGKKNDFLEKMRQLNLVDNKHIPNMYKVSSINNRLKLIAGLLDTDGHVANNNVYDWISKSKEIAQDLAFICRSVGLSAKVTETTKKIKSTGFSGTYWRVSISGNTSIIPCLDKIASPRKQIKRNSVTGINLEPIGDGNYYGFEIDGDKLFLLGDFTVTHNTETVKILAESLDMKLLKYDMSEYSERHSVSSLIGPPPGYVGFNDSQVGGGRLINDLSKNPYAILLFDEVEKADPSIFNIFLQILDEGRITGSNGKEVNCKNTIIIMTSNLGAMDNEKNSIGFGSQEKQGEEDKAVKQFFKPEFRNRLTSILKFNKLDKLSIKKIVVKFLNDVQSKLYDKHGINLKCTEEVIEFLAENGFDPKMGARPIMRKIDELISVPLSKKIIFEMLSDDDITATLENDTIVFNSESKLNGRINENGIIEINSI